MHENYRNTLQRSQIDILLKACD